MPVDLYRKIVQGWSACEDLTDAQRNELSACDSLNIAYTQRKATSDSLLQACQINVTSREREIGRQAELISRMLNWADKQKPEKEKKPFLLNPWTYIVFFAGVTVGYGIGR